MSEKWIEKSEQFLIKMNNLSLKNKPEKPESYILPNGRKGKIVWRSEDEKTFGVEVKESSKATVYLIKVDNENIIISV